MKLLGYKPQFERIKARARRRIRMEPSGGAAVTGGKLHGPWPYINGKTTAHASSQAVPGDTVNFLVGIALTTSDPTQTYAVVIELANVAVPGTVWQGKWFNVKGNGADYQFWMDPIIMPQETMRWNAHLYDADWNRLAVSGEQQVIAMAPTPEPLPPLDPAPEPQYPAPPPPEYGPFLTLLYALFPFMRPTAEREPKLKAR